MRETVVRRHVAVDDLHAPDPNAGAVIDSSAPQEDELAWCLM
jgi:hypothetical protein